MNVLENIAAQRQKLLDGIDANEGDINLLNFYGSSVTEKIESHLAGYVYINNFGKPNAINLDK